MPTGIKHSRNLMFLNEFTGGLKDGWVDVPKNKEGLLCDGVAEKPRLQATAFHSRNWP